MRVNDLVVSGTRRPGRIEMLPRSLLVVLLVRYVCTGNCVCIVYDTVCETVLK
eukprot:SAG11_NODE_685_length_7739_cov_3.487435_1_plen_53_part_00